MVELAQMDRDGWELRVIPEWQRIYRALRPGDNVKLAFIFADTEKRYREDPSLQEHFGIDAPPAAERMWVEVERRERNGYTGFLRNEPATSNRLAYGDRVYFEICHVLECP